MNKFILLIPLLLLIASCNKKSTGLGEENNETLVVLTAQLSDGAVESRVVADYTTDQSSWKFSWQTTDDLSAWSTDCSAPTQFTINEYDEELSTFVGTVGSGDNHRFIYPYDKTVETSPEGYYPIDITDQDGALNKTYLINDEQILTSSITEGVVSDLDMRHLGGFMVVNLWLKNCTLALESYKLTSIEYSDIPVTAQIDMTESYGSDDLHLNKTTGSVKITGLDMSFEEVTINSADCMYAAARLNILPFNLAAGESIGAVLTNDSLEALPFARATHNYTNITIDLDNEMTVTGATINGWIVLESGELETEKQ